MHLEPRLLWLLRYHSTSCPLLISCPLSALNLVILLFLLFLTHSFDLPLLWYRHTHTHTHWVMNIHLFAQILFLHCLLWCSGDRARGSPSIWMCVRARVRMRVPSVSHASLRMSGSDSIGRKRTAVLRPRISALCECTCARVRVRARLSSCVYVCMSVGGHAVSEISEAVCFLFFNALSHDVSVCVRTCVHFCDLKQILLAIIFICG